MGRGRGLRPLSPPDLKSHVPYTSPPCQRSQVVANNLLRRGRGLRISPLRRGTDLMVTPTRRGRSLGHPSPPCARRGLHVLPVGRGRGLRPVPSLPMVFPPPVLVSWPWQRETTQGQEANPAGNPQAHPCTSYTIPKCLSYYLFPKAISSAPSYHLLSESPLTMLPSTPLAQYQHPDIIPSPYDKMNNPLLYSLIDPETSWAYFPEFLEDSESPSL